MRAIGADAKGAGRGKGPGSAWINYQFFHCSYLFCADFECVVFVVTCAVDDDAERSFQLCVGTWIYV